MRTLKSRAGWTLTLLLSAIACTDPADQRQLVD